MPYCSGERLTQKILINIVCTIAVQVNCQLMDKPSKSRTFIHREITGDLCDFYGFYLLGVRKRMISSREGLTSPVFPNRTAPVIGQADKIGRYLLAIGTSWYSERIE